MKFKTIQGDVTEVVPQDNAVHFLPNNCNNQGIAGSGVIVAFRNKWAHTIELYEEWYEIYDGTEGSEELKKTFPKGLGVDNTIFELGNAQFVMAEPQIYVVNMIGQKGFGGVTGMPPGRYEAIEECLRKISICCERVLENNRIPYIDAPMFGAMRSGLDWGKLLKMSKDVFKDIDGFWTTYEYEGPTK